MLVTSVPLLSCGAELAIRGPALGRSAGPEDLYRTYLRISNIATDIVAACRDAGSKTHSNESLPGAPTDTVSMFGGQAIRSLRHRPGDATGPDRLDGAHGRTMDGDSMTAERPGTRRRKSLSDKQLAILEVIQRSVASRGLSAEHARDRRRRRASPRCPASPTSSASSSSRATSAATRTGPAPSRCSSTCRPRTTRGDSSDADRRRRDGAAGRPHRRRRARSPPSSRSRRSSRSPGSSSARATCSCSRSSASR